MEALGHITVAVLKTGTQSSEKVLSMQAALGCKSMELLMDLESISPLMPALPLVILACITTTSLPMPPPPLSLVEIDS